jgi:glycerophosphoryl diester phosphodiesterase
LIEELHGRGIRVIPWTVNRPEDMLEMKRLGADGLITDYPETALALSGLFD